MFSYCKSNAPLLLFCLLLRGLSFHHSNHFLLDGIAASMTISLINYVLLGFQFTVDGFFMHSFEVFLATTVVFWGSGTLGYTLLEYRLGHKKLVSRVCDQVSCTFSFLTFSTYPLHAFDIYICGRTVNLCRFNLFRSMHSLRTSCGFHSCAYLRASHLH